MTENSPETAQANAAPEGTVIELACDEISYRIVLPDSGSDYIQKFIAEQRKPCLLYTSPSPRDGLLSRMPSSA